MYTVHEAAAAAGVPTHMLRIWVVNGAVAPAHHGPPGPGNGHRFTLAQVVGLTVAEHFRRECRGCTPAGVGEVVAAFGEAGEAKLLREFKAGRTHFLATVPWDARDGSGRKGVHLVLGKPAYDDQIDVKAIYDWVAAELGAAPEPTDLPGRPGRTLVVNAAKGK